MTRTSVWLSRRCVAKLCRSVCGETQAPSPATSAAMWQARVMPRPNRQERVAPREQPALRPALPPPRAQHFEQLRRQHGMTVLAALALLDPDQQALAVDIADLQRDHFGRAQPGTVGNAQRRLVLEAGAGRCFE